MAEIAMKRIFFICLITASSWEVAHAAKKPIISKIIIRGTDVFDFETKPNINKFPYSWINLLDIQTKEYVLRQELLFKVGDPVDEFRLRETERNLRALSFIRAARIV